MYSEGTLPPISIVCYRLETHIQRREHLEIESKSIANSEDTPAGRPAGGTLADKILGGRHGGGGHDDDSKKVRLFL